MKIIFVCNDLDYFLAHRRNIMTEMLAQGWQVIVAAGYTRGQDRLQTEHGSAEVFTLALDRYKLNPMADLRVRGQLAELFARESPDVVHSFTVKVNLLSALALQRARKQAGPIPFVMTFAGLGRIFSATGAAAALRRAVVLRLLGAVQRRCAPVVTVENEQDGRYLVEAGGVPQARLVVTKGSGVDLARFVCTHKAQAPVTVSFASRLLRSKGAGAFLAAARRLGQDGRLRFLLAGPVNEDDADSLTRAEISDAVQSGGLEYRGMLDEAGMMALLEQTHIFCLPTLYPEGLPRSLSEAAAMGCALITTAAGNTAGLVEHGITGHLVDGPDALEGAIEALAADPERLIAMGRAAQTRAHEIGIDDRAVVGAFRQAYARARETS